MPPVLNGRVHKKIARAPVGAGRILNGLRNVQNLPSRIEIFYIT